VRAHLDAIDRLDSRVHAYVYVDRDARAGTGPLSGVTLAVKDNLPVAGMPWTDGSAVWRDRIAAEDTVPVARARAAGVAILGKTNLSEWANIRSSHSVSGWSGRGGLTRNPYALDRNPCGSSSGTGAGSPTECWRCSRSTTLRSC